MESFQEQQYYWLLLKISFIRDYLYEMKFSFILQFSGINQVKYANPPAAILMKPVHNHLRLVYKIKYIPMNTPNISLKPLYKK